MTTDQLGPDFTPGDRVRLVHTGDEYTRLVPGVTGTVTRFSERRNEIQVKWDDGSTLSMLLDEGDRVAKLADSTVPAAPYEARQCPECKVWVYTAAGPFAEGDETKTMADCLHYERDHADKVERLGNAIGFPYFSYNEKPVRATRFDFPDREGNQP